MMASKEMTNLLDDIGGELRTLGKDLLAIGENALTEFRADPARYIRDSARDLTGMGFSSPVLAILADDTQHLRSDPNLSVSPVEGSILYINLFGNYAQHSGIYIGDGQIVELSGKGHIRKVDREQFIHGCTGGEIHVSCLHNKPIGSSTVAERARLQLGSKRKYNVVMNNCHQFCAGCLSGDFENSDNFLWMLKLSAMKALGANRWRIWQ